MYCFRYEYDVATRWYNRLVLSAALCALIHHMMMLSYVACCCCRNFLPMFTNH